MTKSTKSSFASGSMFDDAEDSSIGYAEANGSGDGDDQSTKTDSQTGQSSEDVKEKLAQKETRYVFMLRLLVCLILCLAAVAVSFVVYTITANSEKQQLEAQYQGAAIKLTGAFMDIANDKIGAAGALVVALVAHGIDHAKTWPFVTLSSFQRRARSTKDQSGVLYVGISPIVTRDQRLAWENYTLNSPEAEWYNTSIEYQRSLGIENWDNRPQLEAEEPDKLDMGTGVANRIYSLDLFQGAKAKISPGKDQYLPAWQMSPATRRTLVNQDRSSNSEGLRKCLQYDSVVFEGLQYARPGFANDTDPWTSEIAWLLEMANQQTSYYDGDLFSTVYLPLYNDFEEKNRHVVGVMRLLLHWARYFRNILPTGLNGMVMVLDNNCDDPYTYVVNGEDVVPLGVGDLHDRRFDSMMHTADYTNVSSINDGTAAGMKVIQDACPITLRVYPSEQFESQFITSAPLVVTLAVAAVFLFAILMFFAYDRLVERRQRLVLRKAEQTSAIVTSLFPKNVRDRMMDEHDLKNAGGKAVFKNKGPEGIKVGAPIADLFPDATVMFCDIAGFTAWSSSRDPTQVFTLLQNIYQEFDKIAHRRKVFKVETIGDSYVAVTGLPQPQQRHALIMARFAAECMLAMQVVVQTLETTLGPDTADLTMRFGMHSGPVTAGVLMGEKSRFQLFGDTVNTAARMESTGVKNKIQASQATADLLIQAGKQHWVQKREDEVHAKGKGTLRTYWISPWATQTGTSVGSSEHDEEKVNVVAPAPLANADAKSERLVNWMTELFKTYIKEIVAKRGPVKGKSMGSKFTAGCALPLKEVVEVIELPDFDTRAIDGLGKKGDDVEIPDDICNLLRQYISDIAANYRGNPFHNFEHACHVTMSVDKFLKRIVAPDIEMSQLQEWREGKGNTKDIASKLHDYTHGINSDPVALFAIVFGALIHDLDHQGISNVQLCKEDREMAERFESKSVAEQHSLDMAWKELMLDKFSALRNYIFTSESDFKRFRQVIVNIVLATDIFDKELNDLRKGRWLKAFSEEALTKMEINGLRATIVLEHIIQASDVSHTMQHWHIYRKWNRRLFQEMTVAFRAGRMGVDPATFWYNGELGFFDNYIIPLANKLKDCKVFGVDSDQCLVYALKNREEWSVRGEEVLAEMIEEFKDIGNVEKSPEQTPEQAPQQAQERAPDKLKSVKSTRKLPKQTIEC